MRQLAILIYLLTFFSYSQEKKVTQDSIDYYLELANYSADEQFQIENAIKYANKAVSFAKKIKNESKKIDSYYFLGTLYLENNKPEEAIVYFIRCTNYFQTKNISNSKLAKTYFSLGKSYLLKNNQKLANLYFTKSFEIYDTLPLSDGYLLVELQKGLVLKANKKFDEAITVFNAIISQNNEFENTKIEAYFQISEIYTVLNDTENAFNALENAYALAEKNPNTLFKNKILKRLILVCEKNEDYKKATHYLKKIIDLNEKNNSITNENYLVNKKEYDSQLDLVEKLEHEKQDQLKSMKFSKLISILSIALIAILSLLSFSLYKNNKIRNNTFKLLEEKNKELTKEKEKAEQASKARAEFLSTVSHELRTPLNAINGITYLLLQEKPRASQLNYLKSLEFSGSYLLNFINDILEINRLESDVVQVEKIDFNLNELVTNIKQSFNEFIVKNNVNFHTDIDLKGVNNYIGDPTKLSQILINLINNAIKFTKNGDVWLSIKQIDEKDGNSTIAFTIQDNGIGIPKEKIATIFDSFTQGSIEINRTYGGTGLGLSIVKKIIELLGSEITLESDVNKGSKFSFNLILKQSTIPSSETLLSTNEKSLENLQGKSVLLVEDNKINQMITQKMLENKGMICTIIDNGEEAISELAKHNYDVVLMDVHLPGINGTEATEQIRTFNTHTPIVALTAISLNENRETLLSFGMSDVVTKPFKPDYLYEVILSNIETN